MPERGEPCGGLRRRKCAARRKAILDAALREFVAEGYAGARMEDIARRAGVAKGTLYLHFGDKEGLFNGLVESALSPLYELARTIMADDSLTLREKLLRVFAPMFEANGGTREAEIVRLVWSEGLHNPALARAFYRKLMSPLLTLHRETVSRAASEGPPPELLAFPQLLLSPVLHGVLWQGMFRDMESLDMEAMYRAYLDMILPEKY